MPLEAKRGLGRFPCNRFFCNQQQTLFRQLSNGRFSSNLATSCESVSSRKVPEAIFETFFSFIVICPPNPKAEVSHIYLTLTSLQPKRRTAGRYSTVHSTLYYKAREFPNSRQFFRTTNGFKVPQFSFLLIFLPHKMPKSTFLCAAYSLCVT